MTPSKPHYAPISILWHWLIAALIAAAFVIIWSVPEGRGISPEKIKLLNYHKWVGVSVFLFTVLRIASRAIWPAPPLGADVVMPAWQAAVHKLTLLGMLLLTLAIPLLGWVMSSAKGVPVVWLGVLPLPDLVAPDKALGHTLKEAHELAAWGLLALVGLHSAAALKHYFWNHDSVLARMLPFVK